MRIRTSRFPLQRLLQSMPTALQRIKVAQFLAFIAGSPHHLIEFQRGRLIGNIRDDGVANSLVRGTFADYGFFELAGRLLAAGDVYVDLGANYGFHTFGLLDSAVGEALRYVLIDANPDCVACLRESAMLHPAFHIEVIHAAAALTAGEISFTFAPTATGSGRVGTATAGGKQIKVPALPLDEMFAEMGVEKIGLMKMDIEGSEPFAMQSLSKMLASQRVNFVYFEVNPGCLELLGTDPLALFQAFTRHGYRLFWPHDGSDWIRKTYGDGDGSVVQLERFSVCGSQPHTVVAFDQTRYSKGRFGQCDLLAVSANCRVESRAPAE